MNGRTIGYEVKHNVATLHVFRLCVHRWLLLCTDWDITHKLRGAGMQPAIDEFHKIACIGSDGQLTPLQWGYLEPVFLVVGGPAITIAVGGRTITTLQRSGTQYGKDQANDIARSGRAFQAAQQQNDSPPRPCRTQTGWCICVKSRRALQSVCTLADGFGSKPISV